MESGNGLLLLIKIYFLKTMTQAEALKHFRQLYKTMGYRRGDDTAKRTEWNNYTDSLCKDGLITLKQYENWGQPF